MANNGSVGGNSANMSGIESKEGQNSGSNNAAKTRKHRRTANQITKDFKCMHCDKCYGSEAAAIMHMR